MPPQFYYFTRARRGQRMSGSECLANADADPLQRVHTLSGAKALDTGPDLSGEKVGTRFTACPLGIASAATPDLSSDNVETRFTVCPLGIASAMGPSVLGPSVVGLGVDIVDVQRLQTLYDRWQECLLVRLFTNQEQIISRKSSGYRWRSLAGRFGAKEAVKKILASRGEIASWTEIEVLNGLYGEPYINLHGRARSAVERLSY